MYFLVNIPKVLGTAFLQKKRWLLLNYALVFRKKFKEKKVSGEIALALISLFHVQIQIPAGRSTTLRTLAFFAKFC